MKDAVRCLIGVATFLASWSALTTAPAPLARPPRDAVGRYVGWAEIGDTRVEITFVFEKDGEGEMNVLGNVVPFTYQYSPGGKLQMGPAGWTGVSFRVYW